MPCYEYQCSCGHVTEDWATIAERKETVKCEKCGKLASYKFSRATIVAHYPLGHPRVGRGRRDRSNP